MALPRPRHGQHHGEIPEEDLQQRRDIAEGFDIDGGQLAEDPVRRQPRHAEQKTQHGGKQDADDRNQQGIQQADDKHPAVGVAFVVVDQVLGNAKAGIVVEKAEAGNDAALGQVLLSVVEQVPAKRNHAGNGKNLE